MNIKDIQKKIQRYMHRDRSKLYISPYRSWAVILVVWTLLLTVLFGFGYHVYMQYYVEGVGEVSSEGGDVAQKDDVELLRQDVEAALNYFDEKESKHNELLENKQTFESVVEENNLTPLSDQEGEEATTSEDVQEDAESASAAKVFWQQAASVLSVVREIFVDLVW